jgi:hypothetical protein
MTRDGIIRRALQVAGLLGSNQQADANDLSLAADILGMELQALQAEGVLLRTVERTEMTLQASTAEYDLDDSVMDVTVDPDNKVGMVWSTTGSEIWVGAVSRQEYEAIGDKTVEGTPTLCYVEKSAPLRLVFWPVPDAEWTFRYSAVRLVYDASAGSQTLDVNRRWQKAILYALSWQLALAKNLPMDKVGFLKRVADESRLIARSDDHQKGDAQLCVLRRRKW